MPSICIAPICEAVRANLPLLTSMLSPSTNACVVKMTPIKGVKRYRYDPYRANVIAPSPVSCAKAETVAAAAEAVVEESAFGVLPEPTIAFPMQVPVMPSAMLYPYAYDAAYYGGYAAAPMPTVTVGAVPQMPSYYGGCYGYAESSLASSFASVPSTTAPTRVPSPVPAVVEVATVRRGVAPMAVDGCDGCDDVLSECGVESETASVDAAPTPFVSIKFKYETFTYSTPFPLSVGENVVVEGDRGIHMGVVSAVNVAAPANGQEAARVVRRPSAKDAQLWESLCAKAAVATTFAQDSVKDLSLSKLMKVTDAEYQLDQNKLTIFFRSELLVDFRKLQRVLFKEFRCRVWLVNLDEVLDGVVLKKGPWSKMC